MKVKLIGSMFPEKIEYDGKDYRTKSYNRVLDLIYQQTNELRRKIKENGESFSTLSALRTQTRGRTGMEVNPLVFETSASTDSAIWASLSITLKSQ